MRLGLIERLGTGVQRIKESYKGQIVEPGFHLTDHFISVHLPVIVEKKLNNSQKAFLNSMIYGIAYSRQELEYLTGSSRASVTRMLHSLKQVGCIRVIGQGKVTRYQKTQNLGNLH